MKAPPAFQFYAADYLASSKVQRMSLAEQGAYIRLLCYQWSDGYIPDSEMEIARMISASILVTRRMWKRLSGCFVPLEGQPGKLVNQRMEDVRSKLLQHRQERSESGKKGAESKWRDHSPANGSAIKEPLAKNSSPSPSSSPSSKGNTNTVNNSSTPHSPTAEKRVGGFEVLWAAYPNRVRRKEAERHFRASVKTERDLEEIKTALAHYKAHLDQHPTKPPQNGSTWFNNWRDWVDWVEPANGNGRGRIPFGEFSEEELEASRQKQFGDKYKADQ